MLRLSLFLGTNLAVLFILNLVLSVLGLNRPGSGTGGMLVIASIFGMGGAFVSLMLSKKMALRSTRARVIEHPNSETERWLVETVRSQAQRAGIGMPEVAVFDSPSPNAFATGSNKNAALVAVSTGLMQTMNRDEVEAVLGHEVSHVANGDMVTLTLVQGVLNTFVIVFAQIISSAVDRGNGRSYGRGIGYHMTYMAAQAVLGFLATLIVRWFSRYREYRADEGGAELAGRHKMIAALQKLNAGRAPPESQQDMQAFDMRSFGINGGLLSKAGLQRLTMTHPPLEERIAALQRAG